MRRAPLLLGLLLAAAAALVLALRLFHPPAPGMARTGPGSAGESAGEVQEAGAAGRPGGLSLSPGEAAGEREAAAKSDGPFTSSPPQARALSSGSSTEELLPAGQVVEARTGEPVAGAVVRATHSYEDDGYPPLPEPGSVRLERTDPAGRFSLPSFRPEDPRRKLLLEVTSPGFLPLVERVEGEPDLHGRFPFTTLRLRRGLTTPLLFLDPAGRPLAGAAVEVKEFVDGFLGEDSFEEDQTFRPERPTLRSTGEDGLLDLPRAVVEVVLRDPALYLSDLSPARIRLETGGVGPLPSPRRSLAMDLRPSSRLAAAPERPAVAETRLAEIAEYQLQDLSGAPVAGSLVEVSLLGMPEIRAFTDARGIFALGPRPFAPEESATPLSARNPREGTLTVLSPLLWKRRAAVAFPSAAGILILEDRLSGELTFRLTEEVEGGLVSPVAPEGVRISEELTLVRRTAAGEVLYQGPLPRGGTILRVSVAGFLPEEARVAPHRPVERVLDLGEIRLKRGGSLSVALSGLEAELRGRARLRIAQRDWPRLFQEYRPGAEGVVEVGGLLEGEVYQYALEGSGIERATGELFTTKELFRQGLTIPLVSSEEEEVAISLQVLGVGPEECGSYRVVERYFAGLRDPITFLSYPLPPDGVAGSRRRIARPRSAEVFVVGPGFLGGSARRDFKQGGELDLGRLRVAETPHAIVSFRVNGLGPVLPPPDLSLFADENANHQVARLEVNGRELWIANLRPGRYELRWGGNGEEEEMAVLRVRERDLEVRSEVLRKPRSSEVVELRIVDPEGQPVEGARLALEGAGGTPEASPAALSPGRYRLQLRGREENRFLVRAEGFLPLRVALPAGGRLPDPLPLERGARVEAAVRDPGRRPLFGELEISFQKEAGQPEASRSDREGAEPREGLEASLTYGEPLAVQVEKGLLQSGGFPPGLQRITFRMASSEAKAEGVFDLSRRRINAIGTVVLGETRSLSGAVLLPGGEPASGAVVSLVRHESCYRFPGIEPDLNQLQLSARADGLGRFRIDGLPLDLREELDLVAHLQGFTDSIEWPLDLSRREHLLVLGLGTRLVLDVGSPLDQELEDYQFRLEYLAEREEGSRATDLGPIPGERSGGRAFDGITPGLYRVLWGPREPHPRIEPRRAEARVEPGAVAVITLRVNEPLVAGQAFLNGELLERGWLLLLTDPMRARDLQVARVKGGSFAIPVPLRAERGFAALIPEREPLLTPDFFRGEALPVEVRDFRASVRRKSLLIQYRAHDFTLHLPESFLQRNPELQIEFPHYLPTPSGFERQMKSEPLAGSPFRLGLIPEGAFSLRVSGRGGSRLIQKIEIHQDLDISLGG